MTTKDDLVHEIGGLIVADPKIGGRPWMGLALVVIIRPGERSMHGYRYWGDDRWEGAVPERSTVVLDRLIDLRAIMAGDAAAAWQQCLIHLWRLPGPWSRPEVMMTFEYDDPRRWHPTIAPGLDMAGYANFLRPPMS